ncbi:hypothetical protein BO86DRAFT_406476 [Aspergillus japonicus CBS 114.51]|uniref:Uncharacterized protein n=1 Tax=Aspergillus japonicus CBS 114.51 TaxID=1448312 RepID=A0A8T8XDL6_ASPJA|nr:hypothetical protein BO86DRAFT_406476 [Aspergillus japonicus CBS 114.51]RAH86058.1 hypothetical protein BO86DRAFT_406476 [Aspergillus japonicus CBS 114.51]
MLQSYSILRTVFNLGSLILNIIDEAHVSTASSDRMPCIIERSTSSSTSAAHSGSFDDMYEIDRKYWDDLPYIYLSHRAIVEFRKREKTIAEEAEQERKKKEQQTRANRRSLRLPHKLRSLKEFAKNGGPDLSGGRNFGWSESMQACSSTSLYDGNCRNFLKRHGIAARSLSEYCPRNFVTLRERFEETRPSVKRLDKNDQKVWLKACRNFGKRRAKFNDALDMLLGEASETVLTYESEPITGLAPLVQGMFLAQPSYFDCGDFYALDADGRIANDLKDYILPATDAYGVVPNFFVQLQLDDNADEPAELRAMHYGALGARAVQKLRFHAREDEAWMDENAYSIVVVVFEESVTIYGVYMMKPEDESREADYQLTDLYYSRLDRGVGQFRKAVAAVRNARDVAKEWREYFMDMATRALEGDSGALSQGSPMSVDETPNDDHSEGPGGMARISSLSDGQSSASSDSASSGLKRRRSDYKLQYPSLGEELPRVKRPRSVSSGSDSPRFS